MAGEGDDPYHRTMIVNMLRDLQAVFCIRAFFISDSTFFLESYRYLCMFRLLDPQFCTDPDPSMKFHQQVNKLRKYLFKQI
jgi:hypothetical protein